MRHVCVLYPQQYMGAHFLLYNPAKLLTAVLWTQARWKIPGLAAIIKLSKILLTVDKNTVFQLPVKWWSFVRPYPICSGFHRKLEQRQDLIHHCWKLKAKLWWHDYLAPSSALSIQKDEAACKQWGGCTVTCHSCWCHVYLCGVCFQHTIELLFGSGVSSKVDGPGRQRATDNNNIWCFSVIHPSDVGLQATFIGG